MSTETEDCVKDIAMTIYNEHVALGMASSLGKPSTLEISLADIEEDKKVRESLEKKI
jgi:hypothetical protein